MTLATVPERGTCRRSVARLAPARPPARRPSVARNRSPSGWVIWDSRVGANPITHLVTAVRGLMHVTVTAGAIGCVLLASGTLVAAFAPLTVYLYRNKK